MRLQCSQYCYSLLRTNPRFVLIVCTVYELHICTMCTFVHLCKTGQKYRNTCTFAHTVLDSVHLCNSVQAVLCLKWHLLTIGLVN